jgi:rhodanese-related sulfurtransferase
MMPSFLTLGLYQIENLLMARPSFQFLDLRLHPQLVAEPRVQSILAQAHVVRGTDVLNYLQNFGASKDEPVVLLCEDARISMKAAAELDAVGFHQLYVVDGGLDGLLREATSSG